MNANLDLLRHLGTLKLGNAYKFCLELNKSLQPYHNSFHLENVCVFSILGCLYYKIPTITIRLVACAALFHDFNHIGDKNDDKNILEAVKGFLEFNSKFNEFEEEEVSTIIEIIKSTRYPYITKCEDLTQLQKIVRDSDILQGPFCQNYINTVVMALCKETNISFSEMLEKQIEFLQNTKFCTEWATNEYSKILPETIIKVRNAIDIIK